MCLHRACTSTNAIGRTVTLSDNGRAKKKLVATTVEEKCPLGGRWWERWLKRRRRFNRGSGTLDGGIKASKGNCGW